MFSIRQGKYYAWACGPCVAARSKEWYRENRDRIVERRNARRAENPEFYRRRNWETRTGLTSDLYKQMLEEQGHVCAICGKPENVRSRLCVDHDHNCCDGNSRKNCGRCVRGLLCNRCNRVLGLMQDDADRLRRAAAYLEAFSERSST